MKVKPIKTKIFREGDQLVSFILREIPKIKERSVIVVTSKIVALSEWRTVEIEDEKTKERVIKNESDFWMRTKYVWLTVVNGEAMSSAGVDVSNADGKIILLPKDSYKTAKDLRRELKKAYGVKELGVLITDSRSIPLRSGALGAAIGYSGFHGLKIYKGTKDIFGKVFNFSRQNIADSLAAAAVLVMGEGKEQQPLALVESAPIEFSDRIRRGETRVDIDDDLYRPLFRRRSK
jgi:dihydrofolate synthase / folylpolyglutamate synthase